MERNGESRNKRKTSPLSDLERPAKQHKPEISALINGDGTPSDKHHFVGDSEEETRLVTLPNTTADSAEWQATIERVVKNVVSIHFCQTCSFDTDAACSSEATGFVVDAQNGYILTNRHVVCAGPFWGYCIFDNHEEVLFAVLDLIVILLTSVSSVMSILSTAILSTTSEYYDSTLKRSSTCH